MMQLQYQRNTTTTTTANESFSKIVAIYIANKALVETFSFFNKQADKKQEYVIR